MRPLILASTSPFRRQLLERLGIPFEVASPQTDETPLRGESAYRLVKRLAQAKARAVAQQYPNAVIIGCDQVAILDEKIIGKPGNRDNTVAQLRAASGRVLDFLTGICVLDSATDGALCDVEPFAVHFRDLSEHEIQAYVDREQPYGCCGGFKSEGLGITLFERLSGDDPTALIGLPVIRLCEMLKRSGLDVLRAR